MKTIGLTGGIGSGKTTVCRMLEKLGARCFYADTIAREIMESDPAVREEIKALLGEESYRPDGRLNRAYIARQVFRDAEKLRQLNRIVHPRVHQAFEQARRQAEAEGVELLVEEAALIFESGADKHLDKVVVVDAPEEERIRRVVQRDGVSPEAVRERMRHQLPAAELRRRADYVLENTGSKEALWAQVQALYALLKEDP